ncbi:MAG: DsbC family protein [Betaproteobacteria bacterium]|nr:DsbC family protein [Betaproteobacteria bacterium]
MLRKFTMVLVVWAGFAAGSAYGSEAGIGKAFQAKFPQAKVESVARTPFAGLYEVVFDGQIAYTDDKLNFVFFGNLYDMRGGAERNLTRERNAQLNAATLSKSVEQAFKRVRGNGKRVLYTFEDPNCPWCKKLHGELAKMNDLTVYTFLWPILGEDSVEKARVVWCSKDRAKAWDEVMVKGTTSGGSKTCDTPIEKNLELARRFGIRGTPAIYLTDGRQVSAGFVPANELEQALNSVSIK